MSSDVWFVQFFKGHTGVGNGAGESCSIVVRGIETGFQGRTETGGGGEGCCC